MKNKSPHIRGDLNGVGLSGKEFESFKNKKCGPYEGLKESDNPAPEIWGIHDEIDCRSNQSQAIDCTGCCIRSVITHRSTSVLKFDFLLNLY